ncbi:acetamidase/formamidase family protein [Maricaulis maris]|uniref:acetamidase/formamidase family protein n=1 Tax=Maricaulis maris TaxID=74318 RepID=UPI003A90AD54
MDQTTEAVTIDEFPGAARHDAWLVALSALSLSARMDENAEISGHLQYRNSQSGGLIALVSAMPQILMNHPAEPGEGAPFMLLLCLNGRGRLTRGAVSIELADNVLCALDMMTPWSITWRSDFEFIVLQMPRSRVRSRLGRSDPALPIALGSSVSAVAARPILRTLAGHIDMIDQADLAATEIALTELAVSALLAEVKGGNGDLTEVQAAHFRRIAAAIEAHLHEPDLTLQDLARREGMSVRYLQRLFEKRGESFSDHVRALRLERCRVDLIDPNHADESIAAIGRRWGFRDQAHFSRAFSAMFGVPPRQVRREANEADADIYPQRGMPPTDWRRSNSVKARPNSLSEPFSTGGNERPKRTDQTYHLPANSSTVHWGYLSRMLAPVLRVSAPARVTVETLTQHGNDDYDRMVAGDPAAESVFAWTENSKPVDRRGAGPMNSSIFGRGAGEGFGVHICTGPIHVEDAEPGDVIEVEILSLAPRPSANPKYSGKAFASNASAWWGYQYHDLLDQPRKRETVTIFEIDLENPDHAKALYSYVWTPQKDPFGVLHPTIDYPGIPVDHGTVEKKTDALEGIRIPARLHFGFIGVAPREAEIIDSIPPGYFGGNIDNWRLGAGSRIYLPVSVAGALLSIGDGHFAQGDGEINGTGLECSLIGDVEIRLHKRQDGLPRFLRGLGSPIIETADSWVIQSFSHPNYLRDLGRNAQTEVYTKSTVDLSLRNAFRQTRRFLMDTYGLEEDETLALMSGGVDFGITQVADGNLGVHATINKAMFARRPERRG